MRYADSFRCQLPPIARFKSPAIFTHHARRCLTPSPNPKLVRRWLLARRLDDASLRNRFEGLVAPIGMYGARTEQRIWGWAEFS